MDPYELMERTTPGGRRFPMRHRLGTNDGAVVSAILGDDEYRLKSLYPMTGWALDIGAHVGSVAIALALDNPDLRIVAVEALPQNAEVIAANVELAGVADRVFVESAGATDAKHRTVDVTYNYVSVTPKSGGPGVDRGYLEQCHYIGNIFHDDEINVLDSESVTVPGISLAGLLRKYAIDRVTLLKIDCEGCEWEFFRSRSLHKVDRIVGEYHDAHNYADLTNLLGKTHVVEQWSEGTVGLFGAVAR